MPAVRTYEVEITQAVRVSLAAGPSEALARALAELGITDDSRVTGAAVRRAGS